MDDVTTTDLARFGYRELSLAAELLTAYCDDPNILGDGVQVMLNFHSGSVFLTDEDYEVAMMNDDTLARFYTCGECGWEGFAADVDDEHRIVDGYVEHGPADDDAEMAL